MSFKDQFLETNDSFEESGSLIWVYKCKICDNKVPSYNRSMHIYIHKLKGKIK